MNVWMYVTICLACGIVVDIMLESMNTYWKSLVDWDRDRDANKFLAIRLTVITILWPVVLGALLHGVLKGIWNIVLRRKSS